MIDNEWAIHQIRTTVNFAPRNHFVNWYVGGLNYQVEHHLFPRISHAFLNKRGYVIPEDVRSIANDVLRHRIGLTYEAEAEDVTAENVVEDILRVIQVP